MEARGSTEVTTGLYRSALSAGRRRAALWYRLAGGALLVAAAALLASQVTFMIPTGVIGIWAGGLLLVLPNLGRAEELRRAAPLLDQLWTYEITEETLRITALLTTAEWRWSALAAFDEYPEYWLGRPLWSNQPILVVKAAFDPGDQEVIFELAQRLPEPGLKDVKDLVRGQPAGDDGG
jgi:hypothetical protein